MNKILVVLVLPFFFLQIAVAADSLVLDTILVSVDGKPITLQDLRKRVSPKQVSDPSEVGEDPELRYALDIMVLEKLVAEEAAKRRLSVSESESQRYIQQIAARNNLTTAEFEQALKKEGKTLAQYNEQIRYDILRTKLSSVLMKSSPAVSDTEIDAYIESNPDLTGEGAKVKLRQIFVNKEGKSEKKMREILSMVENDLEAGKDFGEVAHQYSESIEGASGGVLGVLSEEDLNPTVASAIEGLKSGQRSELISSAAGFHYFEVEQRFLESNDDNQEDLKNEVKELLEREKAQQWIQSFYTKEIFDLHSIDKKI